MFRRTDDAVGDERDLTAGFVGVEAVVADGLFSLGREVVDDGGDEIGHGVIFSKQCSLLNLGS